jgi:hypothetical protein
MCQENYSIKGNSTPKLDKESNSSFTNHGPEQSEIELLITANAENKFSGSLKKNQRSCCEQERFWYCIELYRRRLISWFDLVGIEPNPGPPTKQAKAKAKAIMAEVKALVGKKKKAGRQAASSQMRMGSVGMMKPQVSVASSYATGQSSGKAQVLRNSVDSCRIVHRELIASLTGAVTFTVQDSFSINPGLYASFPWLSVEAQGWEKYRFNSLRFCSYTRTGSTTPGSILLVPDYDAADVAPASEQIASSYYGTEEDAPWKDICCPLDKNRLLTDRFIRNGPLAANLDVKTYDVGNFYVCATDGTAVNWSKIWVEYDVILINPQLPPGGSNMAGTLFGVGTLTAADVFGTASVAAGNFIISNVLDVITISGLGIGTEYDFAFNAIGTGISAFSTTDTNLTTVTALGNGYNSAATNAFASFTAKATASTATITIACTASTITSSYLVITPLIPAPSF